MSWPKPWEQTWFVGERGVEDDDGCDVFLDDLGIFDRENETLAAAAPELVRALMASEYSSARGYEGEMPVCSWCGGMDPCREQERYDGSMESEHYGLHVGHLDDCQRQAALRKAGVL